MRNRTLRRELDSNQRTFGLQPKPLNQTWVSRQYMSKILFKPKQEPALRIELKFLHYESNVFPLDDTGI